MYALLSNIVSHFSAEATHIHSITLGFAPSLLAILQHQPNGYVRLIFVNICTWRAHSNAISAF